MDEESRQKQAIETVETLRRRLRQIEADYLSPGSNYYTSVERLMRWREAADRAIRTHFQEHESRKFEKAWSQVLIDYEINFEPLTAYLTALREIIQTEPYVALADDEPPAQMAQVPSGVAGRVIPQTRRVLLIHGHDDANLLRLADVLRARGLQPIILRQEPAKGRTLIEKFEQVAATCAFAFALMTPDDQVRIDVGKPDVRDYYDHPAVQMVRQMGQQYAQARPNVTFELGWMYGQLGRDRVCILFKKGTQIHSDLEGIERIEFAESVEEAVSGIERELKAAGLL